MYNLFLIHLHKSARAVFFFPQEFVAKCVHFRRVMELVLISVVQTLVVAIFSTIHIVFIKINSSQFVVWDLWIYIISCVDPCQFCLTYSVIFQIAAVASSSFLPYHIMYANH